MADEKSYQIIETIASGGTAVLYKAVQTSLDRAVAVKKLHPHLTSDHNFTRRFILEAKAAASLDHENIVHVIDFGVEDDSYQIVMEYVEGQSLKRVMEQWSPMPLEFALAVVHQILLGLEHAHAKGIVHRDIKPGNVLLTRYGKVKITDFGLAKLTQSKTQDTAANSILGTPLYMSPEQAFGESVDCRSDLFSLGTMMYEMITGKQPFASENYMGVIQNIINRSVPSPKRMNCEIPPKVEAILSRALSKNRDARFQTASQFRIAVEEFLGPSRLKETQDNLKSLLLTNSSTIALQSTSAAGLVRRKSSRQRIATFGALAAAVAAAALIALAPGARNKISNLFNASHSPNPGENQVMAGSMEEGTSLGVPNNGKAASVDSLERLLGAAVDTSRSALSDSMPSENPVPPRSKARDGSKTAYSAAEGGKAESDSAASPGSDQAVGDPEIETSKSESKPAVKKGWLSVSAYPHAEVHIDGKYVGDTPPSISVELVKGRHKLECKNPHYEPYVEVVRIVSGELSRREIVLKKLKGQISLAATEGAEFYIDGKFIGITPIKTPISVEAGPHQLSLKKVGFHMWSSEIDVPANKVLPLKIILSPRY
ncbi:MAG: protein kinase [Candidatus Latescibacteria bacterium]|nr:protein kinase [Candidatus Latescibacterota bacterium]NIM66441.1 protein kinase [Candidatus Latescibacterota bacterium]NIO02921.1 protein kinase [Candidatus Latescibacterota bacterium]NIO30056.1 protein kinase [Candidatus Latescibacterota bacterium]NIO57671.1 protein kinase [Candidatus Latescibacterota bacterium]